MAPYGKSPTKLAHTICFFLSCICIFSLFRCVCVWVDCGGKKNSGGNEVSVVNSDSVKEMKQ